MTEEMAERIKADSELIYHTREWKKKRADILKRDHYECQRCIGKFGKVSRIRITKADTVHHIQTLDQRPDLMMNDDNLISLCHSCHDIVHGRTPKIFNKPKKKVASEKW